MEDLVAFHVPIEDLVYSTGTPLFEAEAPATAIFCIRHGVVKLVKKDASEEARIVRILQKHDVVGLESMFLGTNQHTAIAISEVHACRVPLEHFRRFVSNHPSLQMRILEKSHEALREADSWLSELVSNVTSARVRIARLLLRLRVGDSDRIHRLSLADLSSILGLTQETISRTLSEMIRKNILTRAGKGTASRHLRGDIPALIEITQGN